MGYILLFCLGYCIRKEISGKPRFNSDRGNSIYFVALRATTPSFSSDSVKPSVT